jgi:hypothetical protein
VGVRSAKRSAGLPDRARVRGYGWTRSERERILGHYSGAGALGSVAVLSLKCAQLSFEYWSASGVTGAEASRSMRERRL